VVVHVSPFQFPYARPSGAKYIPDPGPPFSHSQVRPDSSLLMVAAGTGTAPSGIDVQADPIMAIAATTVILMYFIPSTLMLFCG